MSDISSRCQDDATQHLAYAANVPVLQKSRRGKFFEQELYDYATKFGRNFNERCAIHCSRRDDAQMVDLEPDKLQFTTSRHRSRECDQSTERGTAFGQGKIGKREYDVLINGENRHDLRQQFARHV
jgi:hypothetical protein